jgi:hypothetical protein
MINVLHVISLYGNSQKKASPNGNLLGEKEDLGGI